MGYFFPLNSYQNSHFISKLGTTLFEYTHKSSRKLTKKSTKSWTHLDQELATDCSCSDGYYAPAKCRPNIAFFHYTRNVLLSTRRQASWLVYISTLKSIVLFISDNCLLNKKYIYDSPGHFLLFSIQTLSIH